MGNNEASSNHREIRQVEDRETWNQYLHSNPGSNFYQRYEWKEINSRNFGHESMFLGAYEADRLAGVLPLVYINSLLMGKIVSSMPFVNFGGICATDAKAAEQLLDEACRICRESEADYLEIRSLEPTSDSLESTLHKVSLSIELTSNPQDLWDAFKSKHRTSIRRVYKEGITVKKGHIDLLDDFYLVLSNSWRALGSPIYRKSYFRDIVTTFGDNIGIFVAYMDDHPVAAAFNGYYRETVEGMWAGSLPEARKLMPNYVLYWEMIEDACNRGCRQYHLGRSTIDSGAEYFKRKWNADSKQLYYQYFLNKQTGLPELNKENPKFQMAIKAWTRLPVFMTTTIGPLISKNIP